MTRYSTDADGVVKPDAHGELVHVSEVDYWKNEARLAHEHFQTRTVLLRRQNQLLMEALTEAHIRNTATIFTATGETS